MSVREFTARTALAVVVIAGYLHSSGARPQRVSSTRKMLTAVAEAYNRDRKQ